MSIKLTLSAAPKKFGLQNPAEAKPKPINVFRNDDEDSDGEAPKGSEAQQNRRAVNRELEGVQRRAEQLARQAQQASSKDPDIYDYDRFFEQKELQREQSALMKREKVKDAKYMSKMVQSSMDRKMENDIWRAARMKKEAEQISAELQGQVPEEKFVTKAWKEKLDEIWQYKQRQAEVDAEDEKQTQTRKNFGKSLIEFRQKMLALSEEEQAEAKQEREQLEAEHYASLNLGIKAAVKKERKEELRVERELQKQEAGIQEAIQQAAELMPPPASRATGGTDKDTAVTHPEGEGTPSPAEDLAPLEAKFGPSEALLRRLQRKEEPLEVRLERKRRRWATSLTLEDIVAAKERFFCRRAERDELLDRGP